MAADRAGVACLNYSFAVMSVALHYGKQTTNTHTTQKIHLYVLVHGA